MQKCWVTKETMFRISFTDSEDARAFYSRTYDPFNYIGSFDYNGFHEIVASFEKPEDALKFEQFLSDNLVPVCMEKGKQVYQLYKPSIPEKVREGE